MRTVLTDAATDDLITVVEGALDARTDRRPRGVWTGRQPAHTVYVPADRIAGDTVASWGRKADRLLAVHAPSAGDLAAVFDLDLTTAEQVRARVDAKLATEPIEDLRIDFEDGYGVRDDDEEDRHAEYAAHVVGGPGTPSFVGLRVKSFADGAHRRAIRTLDGFLSTVLDETGGTLPEGFVVTFPKIVATAHVEAFAALLDRLERALGLAERSLVFEVQIETTESIIDHAGRITLPALVRAASGRLVGAHFGVFDYTAAVGLPGDQQRLDHPACDFARNVMQVALAGTGIRLADGSTNRVPADDSSEAVHAVWRHHAGLVRHSLRHGFFQGWDLHPSHLVSRFTTLYAFHLAHLDDTLGRLAAWTTGDVGGVADEPATIAALLASLRRAIDCGAIDEERALAAAGIDRETLTRR